MDFKEFYRISEAQDPDEIDWSSLEHLVPDVWNLYLENKKDVSKTFEKLDPKYTKFPAVTEKYINNIIEFLSNIGVKDKFIHSGAGMPGMKHSSFWKEYTKKVTGDEPKTNFFDTPSEKFRISFKKPKTRLMFAGKDESKATFHAAFNTYQESPGNFEKFMQDLESQMIESFKITQNISTTKEEFAKLVDALEPIFQKQGLNRNKEEDIKKLVTDTDDIKKALDRYTEIRIEAMKVIDAEELKQKMRTTLDNFLTTNPEFKSHVILEALSGNQKFEPGSAAIANKIMVTLPDSGLSKIRDIDMTFAQWMSANPFVVFTVDFKPSIPKGRSMGNAMTAIKIQPPTGEGKRGDPRRGFEYAFFGTEEYHKVTNKYRKLIDEEYLNEGIIDKIKAWLVTFAKWLYEKIALAVKSGLNVLETLLGVEGEYDVIDRSTNEDFYNSLG